MCKRMQEKGMVKSDDNSNFFLDELNRLEFTEIYCKSNLAIK